MATRTAYHKFRKWFTFDNQSEQVRAINELLEAEYKQEKLVNVSESTTQVEQVSFNQPQGDV